MGRWRGVWTLSACLALSACRVDSSPPSSNEPMDDGREIPVADRDAGTGTSPPDASTAWDAGSPPADAGAPAPPDAGSPPADAGAPASPDAGTVSDLEAEPSLIPRACIPWTHGTPPVRATACGVDSVLADGSTQRARYDTDSHLLELRTQTAEGKLSSLETHVWQDGLERLSRLELPDGSFDQTEWRRDAGHRLSWWERTGAGSLAYVRSRADFTYDAQDRISQVVSRHNYNYYVLLTSDYAYDATGKLVAIQNDGECGAKESRCATLSYWPNGRLKLHEWQEGRHWYARDEYDELGQHIHESAGIGEGSYSVASVYDAKGRAVRVRRSFSGTTRSREVLVTTFYDTTGQRERTAQDITDYENCHSQPCPLTERPRVTRRTTFICDTSIVALDEWDRDEDGVVDARRTHERDATGRLVREEYSGAPGMDSGPVRRDFRYDCP